jgi:large repetitive protein
MRLRFLQVFALMLVALGAFAGVARALDFDDEDPEPPHSEVGEIYSYTIGSHAGCLPHRLEIVSGALPLGLSIRRIALDKHVVEGVPTEAGTFSAWIALRDCDNKSSEALFTFDVWARRWAITTQSLKPAVTGAAYSQALQGAGPDSSVTWELTAGSLPAGLSLGSDGTISGTPTAAGSSTFTVKATAAEKNFGPTRVDSHDYTLTVLAPLSAQISRTTAEVKTRFRATLVGTGGQGPYTWSATGLPAGLVLSSNGTVSGMPKRAGSSTFTARVTDSSGATTDVRVRLVVRPHLAIATRALRAAASGRHYRAQLVASGGVEGKRWSLSGELPAGLRLDASTGTIAGVAHGAGTSRIVVRVQDALGASAKKTLTLMVR